MHEIVNQQYMDGVLDAEGIGASNVVSNFFETGFVYGATSRLVLSMLTRTM